MDVRSSPTDPAIASTLDAVADLARARAATRGLDPDMAASFTRALYGGLAADDLAAASIADRAGAALSVLDFARERPAREAKVRVYDPSVERHGYAAHYSVVEIVNDDMPFLVDSVTVEITRRELAIRLLAHPVISARRDAAGLLVTLGGDGGRESVMRIEIDHTAEPEALAEGLRVALGEVRLAVGDWLKMRAAALEAALELGAAATRGGGEPQALEEAAAFLRWAEGNHFTFLGHRRYRYEADGTRALIDGTGLGILRDRAVRMFDPHPAGGAAMTAFARSTAPILLLKSDRPSHVHRGGAMDVIVVKSYGDDGKVSGERRFCGLFTSSAYHASPRDIPLLRRKVAQIVARAGFDPAGHDGKALLNILETHPRDEMFQSDNDTLYAIATGVLRLQERQHVALFTRRDSAARFLSCLVYAPRDRYDSDLRRRFMATLERAYDGVISGYSVAMGDESTLARVLFSVRPRHAEAPLPDDETVERQLADVARTWADRLRDSLTERYGEIEARKLARRFGGAFPVAYRDAFDGGAGARDLVHVSAALSEKPLGIELYRRGDRQKGALGLKLFNAGAPIALSDVLPMLENMDLRVLTETPYHIVVPGEDGGEVWLHDFGLDAAEGRAIDPAEAGERFETALGEIWTGAMESDGMNRLVLRAGLDSRDVTVLRAYARFLRQAGIAFSQDYMERALAAHPDIAAGLVRLFHARLDPGLGATDAPARVAAVAAARDAIAAALEQVTSLDEDRILRRLLSAMNATLRSNFWRAAEDGGPKSFLSLKIDSRALDELPAPRPLVEIFVYSPRVEGTHLRGGRVARGGIRWSDRREDFRTEILGLMKAQMVKNAVIVPVGSKGGFYCKRVPVGATREQVQAEGVECYKTLIRGMLDITDNLDADGTVEPPPDIVRHDGDDPYLVVAADKGTATFSDIANGVSAEYDFWLGDAFASGGSAGYDHKKMGITARGAWENVRRHFRELGADIQEAAFTAVGVGDMSGDVFGNGMLRSKHTRLLAAFDHRHIFVDPTPDSKTSFAERQRLFDLPRSSWADYDKTLLSPGGFVVERGAKSVAMTDQAKAVLGVSVERLTPVELMRAILKAPVDLLFFAGIGNYVKAASESHAEAGDRANDALRIDGVELRAKVVGEGANLGATQRGRIEAAQHGVRLNTDALDNSAGVDTSDHEVNIKIALGDVVRRGALTVEERDRVLASMTDDVAALVLRHNYQQSQAITVATAQAGAMHERHARMMRALERAGRLDRAVEFLPDNDLMKRRATAGQPLTRAELSVLLAYGKLAASDEILASDLPDDPLLEAELLRYFPAAMQQRYGEAIRRHRLRREIITLQVVNSMVNRVGGTFVHDIRERTGAGGADIARCFAIVRDSFALRDIWGEIEALDPKLVAEAQTAMLIASQRLTERGTVWCLRNLARPVDMTAAVTRLKAAMSALDANLESLLPEGESQQLKARADSFARLGAPDSLAMKVARLDTLAATGDLAHLADGAGVPVAEVARVYFALAARLGLDWLRGAAERLPRDNHWTIMAGAALIDDLAAAQRTLTASALHLAASAGGPLDANALLDAWTASRRDPLDRAARLITDLKAQANVDVAMLTVAAQEMRSLA